MMNVYLFNLWNQLKGSFWLLPAFMALATIGFSFVTLNWDHQLEDYDISSYSIWQGGPDGARQLLSTIAGSTITITGVVFSITLVSLALASAQFGSRIIRNFMRDVATQFVLGTFISTSMYALLILRTVRSDTQEFIPNLSITISIGFALLSLSMLIFFIHHLSVRVQASDVIVRVADDLFHMVQNFLQDYSPKKESLHEMHKNFQGENVIFSSQVGYLQAIDYQRLYNIAKKTQGVIDLHVRPGHFIRRDSVLAKVRLQHLSPSTMSSILKAFIIGKERSPIQDVEYAIDQLVTIALRALSGHANDTFTANSCVDHLGAALCLICRKELNPPYYSSNHYIRLISKQLTFVGLVDACFNQIRQYGSHSPSVLTHLLETLTSILSRTQSDEQRSALKKHAMMIKSAGEQLLEERDRLDVRERYDQFHAALEKYMPFQL